MASGSDFLELDGRHRALALSESSLGKVGVSTTAARVFVGSRQVLAQHREGENGAVLVGRGVERTAHRLDPRR
jgi:hypothetical protein